LPRDVRVLAAREALQSFNARHDAWSRRYSYYIIAGGPALPHRDRYAWHLQRRPNLIRLNRMVACLQGELDCTTFAAAKDPSASRCRYIHYAAFRAEGESLVFEISANAFLWRMVRSIVGTVIGLEREGAAEDALAAILAARDRSLAGVTAPAHGLFLSEVVYPPAAGGAVPGPVPEAGKDGGQDDDAGISGQVSRLVPGIGWV